ncbi:MAG: aspartate/glutamate racemase family protein [Pseudomonadota bacterium]
MPKILPSLPDVHWPATEGAIGIVGVAPWATADFLTQIYAQVPAKKDWDFPRVLVDANSKIPSRGRYFDLGETDPSPFIADTIDELVAAGATAVVVPCNTAHILFDRWAARAPDKIVSIITATLDTITAPKGARVAVLGSSHLVRHATYTTPLEARGLVPVELHPDQQALVGKVIGEVKISNNLTASTVDALQGLLGDLQDDGVTTIVLGCTELAQGLRSVPEHRFSGAFIDSNVALAREALRQISGQ